VPNMKHIPYPSIEQFRNAIHKVGCKARHAGIDVNGDPVYDHTKVLPVLTYEGTVKLHGTNAAICTNVLSGEVWFQSRENVIALEKDNAGFVRHFEGKFVRKLFSLIEPASEDYAVFGEWCGGNIQPNVGIAKLSKRFVVFGVLADDKWLGKEAISKVKDETIGVYNIYDYPCETIEIDFNKPEISQNKLSELTIKVEESCPVAKAMGVDGIGEGIVWKCVSEGWESPEFYFKVKGELHSKSKVITLKPIDLEKLDKATTLAVKVTPEWRLAQMLDKACDLMNGGKIDRSKVGDFIKLVTDDVTKEETHTIKEAGVDAKDISGHIAKIARNYFFEREKVQ
jgi:hypothetical protein